MMVQSTSNWKGWELGRAALRPIATQPDEVRSVVVPPRVAQLKNLPRGEQEASAWWASTPIDCTGSSAPGCPDLGVDLDEGADEGWTLPWSAGMRRNDG